MTTVACVVATWVLALLLFAAGAYLSFFLAFTGVYPWCTLSFGAVARVAELAAIGYAVHGTILAVTAVWRHHRV